MCRAITFTGSICQIVSRAMCLFLPSMSTRIQSIFLQMLLMKYLNIKNDQILTIILVYSNGFLISLWTCASNKKFNGYPHLSPTTHKSTDIRKIPYTRAVCSLNHKNSTTTLFTCINMTIMYMLAYTELALQ
jgi:hypothetical protein